VVTGGPIARIEALLRKLPEGLADAQLVDCFQRSPLHLVVTPEIDVWCAPHQSCCAGSALCQCLLCT
jgi:hypothetical protein